MFNKYESVTISEERNYKQVRQEIIDGLNNSKDKWLQDYICIVFDIIEDKFKPYKSEHYNDMINAGIIGILTAKKKFDENKGTKFTTYAYISIYNAIVMYVRNINNAHAGRNKWQKCYKKIRELIRTFQNEDMSDSELYERVWIELRNTEDLSRNDFFVLWIQATGKDISYEALKENIGAEFDIADDSVDIEGKMLSDELVKEVYKYIEDNITNDKAKNICKEYVERIIKGDKFKCTECAKKWEVSKQYVHSVIEGMRDGLKEWIRKERK